MAPSFMSAPDMMTSQHSPRSMVKSQGVALSTTSHLFASYVAFVNQPLSLHILSISMPVETTLFETADSITEARDWGSGCDPYIRCRQMPQHYTSQSAPGARRPPAASRSLQCPIQQKHEERTSANTIGFPLHLNNTLGYPTASYSRD